EALPTNATVECNNVPTAETLTAADNCGTATVTFNETRTDGACDNAYSLERVWTATDECGLTTVHTQTITVEDTTAPVLSDLPDTEITVVCGTIPDVPTITATDNCDDDVQLDYQETETTPDSDGNYVITRTWTYTDACGNESIFVQTVNVGVIDITTTVPSIDICVEDISIDLDSYLVGITDSNGTWNDDNASGGLSGSDFDPSIVNIGSYQFTYTSSDETCNTTVTLIINVNDDCVVLPCSIEDDLKISKVVTPNFDGINDIFEIEGLEGCGFTFDVKIFNRWGKMVFESKDYMNSSKWDGRNFGGMTVGTTDELPTGTYYYVVNVIGSGAKPRTGYIYLGNKD
ncbi:MAG: gliding motility-associated C-terminal domain-containing protein, partial [Flavobacteriaceae bacterium]|nr:gliding motility-associated C-terminal domain-containing protein [Flavobacteriaceae bacterium]